MTVKELKEKLEKYNDDLDVRIANVCIEDDESMPTFKLGDVESASEIAGDEFDSEKDVEFIFLQFYDDEYIKDDYNIYAFIFVDAQEMHRNNPDRFEVPSQEELDKLDIGDVVKVCDGYERFWTIITHVDGDFLQASINNHLLDKDKGRVGDIVEFEKRHIYAIYE
jgi:hypothetical protein